MTDMPRWQKLRLHCTVIVVDDDSMAHTFGPGDEVPDWAKDRIGGHAWNRPMRSKGTRVRGLPTEVVASATHTDGRPAVIDVVCTHGANDLQITRFEAVEQLDPCEANGLREDGLPPRWQWWWTAKLNGPAGPFARRSTVRWESVGADISMVGALIPRHDDRLIIDCNLSECPQRIERRWWKLARVFDTYRFLNTPRVSMLELNRQSRSISKQN